MFYDLKCWLIQSITNKLISAIARLNRYKDNSLASQLHDLADKYDTRPSGKWLLSTTASNYLKNVFNADLETVRTNPVLLQNIEENAQEPEGILDREILAALGK